MTDHSSPRFGAARRKILAACLAAALTAGAAAHSQLRIAPSDRASPMFSGLSQASRMADARKAAPAHPFVSIPVTTCADAGSGSLREATALANDGDEIDLRGLELLCSTITLESGAIALDVNATVQGPGSDALTIDGGNTDRVFYSTAGLTISDLTISHGNHAGGDGGCIVVYGADLTLTRSVVTDCHAGDGNNAQSRGGGAFVGGSLYMQASTISLSSASASDRAYGGGAFAVRDVYLDSSIVAENTATSSEDASHGGGVSTLFGSVSMVNGSRVANNIAQSTLGPAAGGGIFASGAISLLMSAAIGNDAESEAATSYGGGMHSGALGVNADDYTIALVLSTLSGNTATTNCSDCRSVGGGAHASGAILAIYGLIYDNRVIAPSELALASGGGLATTRAGINGRISLVNNTLSGNRAAGGDLGYGGGLATTAGSPFFVYSSTIAHNEGSHFGGGATGNGGLLQSTIVANNEAPIGTNADISPSYPFDPIAISGENNIVIASSSGVSFLNEPLHEDPLLLPLADMGGLTLTHALGVGSPALDAGANNLNSVFDQRFCPFARDSGSAVDIGAFEQPTTSIDYVFAHGFDTILLECDP